MDHRGCLLIFGILLMVTQGLCRSVHHVAHQQRPVVASLSTLELSPFFPHEGLRVRRGASSSFDDVFIGRCMEFQTIVHPELFLWNKVDCRNALELFRSATNEALKQAANNCSVDTETYAKVLDAMDHPVPSNVKFLLYSRVQQDFLANIANQGRRFFYIGVTLMGYTLNMLNWCGLPEFPFSPPPTKPNCTCFNSHAELSYWIKASEKFAEKLKGEVYIALNGSNPDDVAFGTESVLKSTELPRLLNKTKDVVQGFTVLLAHDSDLKKRREDCSSASIKELAQTITQHSFTFSCINDPKVMRLEKCKDAGENAQNCRFMEPNSSISVISSVGQFGCWKMWMILLTFIGFHIFK